ncbi:hypothetical protein [Symbioplanes lichenis]|uniref:hypothetical protein n=1 Tax=Symbioplanes lichenis TaxID=1629072 RepID=UPI002738FBD2|nr:hypothetical protein [Actinoplanes lichenis]
MTDLDTFRNALEGPGDSLPPALDDIMGAGRRLRLKRRLATVTVAAAALVVAAGSTVTVWQAQAPPAVQAAAWPTSASAPDGTWGAPVRTGIKQNGREIVLTAFRPDHPGVGFGVRACVEEAGGKLGTCVYDFDDAAPDRSPGFHSVGAVANEGGTDFPMYGYYVGPAASVTATSRGKVVAAQTAQWSEDPDVVLFWFPLDQVFLKPDKTHPNYAEHKVTPGEEPDMANWAAFDADGNALPVGTPVVRG